MEGIITKVVKVTTPIKNESLFQGVLAVRFQLFYIACVNTL